MKRAFLSLGLLFLFTTAVYSQDQERQRPQRVPNLLSQREKDANFELLFDGEAISTDIWQGAVDRWKVADGTLICEPGGNLLTKKEYQNFVVRFDFKLPPAGNNGFGIRTKLGVDPAYNGAEIQILDDENEKYANLNDWQAHGSIYRIAPSKRGSLRPVGEWNTEEIIVFGNKVRVMTNRQVILDTDITDFIEGKSKPFDGKEHVFNEKGLVGFLGHNDPVAFRSVRIKEISEDEYKALIVPRTRRTAAN